MTKQEQEQFKAMQEQLANKDKVIADQQKQIADSTKVVERATESPVMYMDVWNKSFNNALRQLELKIASAVSKEQLRGVERNEEVIQLSSAYKTLLEALASFNATARREYTLEKLNEMVEEAKAKEGICCRSYKFQGASNQTSGAVWSGQVYGSHCMTYEQDNAEKTKAGTTYQTIQFSKNIGGVNVFKNPLKSRKIENVA